MNIINYHLQQQPVKTEQQTIVQKQETANATDKQVKDDNSKIKKALFGLAVAGTVIATGIGIYKGKIKPKKAVEQITDITQDGIGKLLKENNKLTGKFSKTMKDGSKVVVEYADGVLQKSTKTAKDGTQIFQKIYSKANNGDLLVNGKNITEIANKAKQHQDDFYKLMQKSDVSLEELQNFDRKNLSKIQIDDLDVKINKKQQAIELQKQKAKEAEELAKKKLKEAEELAKKQAEEAKALAEKQAIEAEELAKKQPKEAKIVAEKEIIGAKTATEVKAKSQNLFDEYNVKSKEIIENNRGNIETIKNEQFKLNMDFAQRYVDENIDELDRLLLDEKGRISCFYNNQRQHMTLQELIQPYNGNLGDIYHGTTPEAKASILEKGFDLSIRPKHGFLDGAGGAYFTTSNTGNYGDGIIKAKFNGRVAQVNTDILNNIKTDTKNRMFTLDKLLKKQGFEKYSEVDEAIMLKYLQKKIKDMGYQGILGTNYSATANCRYFAALDPSLIEIIS